MSPNGKENIIVTGVVTEALPNAVFRVKIDSGFEKIFFEKNEILAHLSGKMRIHYIKVLVGDKVKIDISPYDTTKGRIVQRM